MIAAAGVAWLAPQHAGSAGVPAGDSEGGRASAPAINGGQGRPPSQRPPPRMEPAPEELEGVGITEHLETMLPLELEFRDENGRAVKIGDFFNGDKPVIFTFNYYRCPMLCGLQLNGMVDGLQQLKWSPGKEFDLVTVSFNPLESPVLAKLKKQNYVKEYGRPSAKTGWHFLTGRKEEIEALTSAVGFAYKWVPARKEYAHAAALIVCTPDGKISRYLYGVVYEPQDLKLALLEASEGKIGTTLDRILLYCFHYDAAAGRYGPAVMNIMRVGGALTVIILVIVLGGYWAVERRRSRMRSAEKKPSEGSHTVTP
ncbi:SCO family protein [bacterium]|nr:SCO family protein [bacterium]